MIALYAVLKFVGYSAWGYLGYRIHGVRAVNLFQRSLSLGAIRLLFGIVLGVFVFTVVQPSRDTLTYIAVYTPIRFFEWGVTGSIFYSSDWGRLWRLPRFYGWIAGGIVVSFVVDLASPDFLRESTFCVGRCFC